VLFPKLVGKSCKLNVVSAYHGNLTPPRISRSCPHYVLAVTEQKYHYPCSFHCDTINHRLLLNQHLSLSTFDTINLIWVQPMQAVLAIPFLSLPFIKAEQLVYLHSFFMTALKTVFIKVHIHAALSAYVRSKKEPLTI
jgi:hypothetical protein